MSPGAEPAAGAPCWLERNLGPLAEIAVTPAALAVFHAHGMALGAAPAAAAIALSTVLLAGSGRRFPPLRWFPYLLLTMVVWRYGFGLGVRALLYSGIWAGFAAVACGVVAVPLVRDFILRRDIAGRLLPPALWIGARIAPPAMAAWVRIAPLAADYAAAETLVLGCTLFIASRFRPDPWHREWIPDALLAAWFVLRVAAGWSRPAPSAKLEGLRTAASAGMWSAAAWAAAAFRSPEPPLFFAVCLCWGGVALAALRFGARAWERRRGPAGFEALRWAAVAACGVWLLSGMARLTINGTPDAAWYATAVADAATQLRSLHFPFWSGQSEFQFNGAFYPLRVAPGYLYLGAWVDALSFHSLGFLAVQNLTLILIGVAAILSAYLCLASACGGRRNTGALLAVLFLGCPGVIGVVYNTDLYMSWSTLPAIPIVWWATVRSFRDRGATGTLLALGLSLGWCWWGHSPIAVWSTSAAAAVQMVRLIVQRPGRRDCVPLAVAALGFAAVAGYPIGSVLFFPPEIGGHADSFQKATPENISQFLSSVYPRVYLPVSMTGRALSDFQLGYSLWIALAVCGVVAAVRRRAESAAVTLVAVVLCALLLPLAQFETRLWAWVPSFIRDTTGNWVMNRLYVVLAATVAFAAASVLGDRNARPQWRARAVVLLLLMGGCAWTIAEARKFAAGSYSQPVESATDRMRPENVAITQFAYLVFPRVPDRFTHGVTEPSLEYRVVDPETGATIDAGPEDAARSGHVVAQGAFIAPPTPSDVLPIDTTFTLAPGRSYVLEFTFADPARRGVLQVSGPHLHREYALPDYGSPSSFGAGGRHSRLMPLSNSTREDERISLDFVPQPRPAQLASLIPFASLRLIEYDPASLPVRVTGWMPFQAEVHTARASLLVTPRVFQSAYRATVDSRPVPVTRTPDGLARIAVPAGRSHVVLVLRPPLALQALFWISAAAIAGAWGWAARAAFGPGFARIS